MMSIIITVTLDSLCHAEIQISWSPFPEKDFADAIFMTEWAELFPVVWSNYMGLAECLTMWSWYTQSVYYMNLLLEWTSLSEGKAPSDNTLSAQHTKYVLQYALMFQFCIYSNDLATSSNSSEGTKFNSSSVKIPFIFARCGAFTKKGGKNPQHYDVKLSPGFTKKNSQKIPVGFVIKYQAVLSPL